MLGSAGSGKCFARGTEVLMADGSARAVESISVGDSVMGDDGASRRVLSLARGVDTLFEVSDLAGEPVMTVTREHVLCLKRRDALVEMTVADFLELPPAAQAELRCYRAQPGAPESRFGFAVQPVAGAQEYFGFQTDGNQRFLLADFTVTHNSTIVLKVAKQFYEASDVGVLSNNMERQFGISALVNKFMVVGPEVKTDFKLEQAEFQSMVSGEDVQVAAKFKTAYSTVWDVPGILAGNEVPSWCDNSGSIQRRLVVFKFMRTVLNGDMRLGDKLGEEMPTLLLKCNRAYLEAAARWGHRNIWTVLPEYFKETRDSTAEACNAVESFLNSEFVVFGPDKFVSLSKFKAAFKSYEAREYQASGSRSRSKMTVDYFSTPMAKKNVHITKRETRAYRDGVTDTRVWVAGMDLAEFADGGAGLGMLDG